MLHAPSFYSHFYTSSGGSWVRPCNQAFLAKLTTAYLREQSSPFSIIASNTPSDAARPQYSVVCTHFPLTLQVGSFSSNSASLPTSSPTQTVALHVLSDNKSISPFSGPSASSNRVVVGHIASDVSLR